MMAFVAQQRWNLKIKCARHNFNLFQNADYEVWNAKKNNKKSKH